MRPFLCGLAICFEVAAAICDEAAAWLADLGESEEDRDERLIRGEMDRLWQTCQPATPPPAAQN